MSTLLEVLLTFIGVMFVLALAAQSIQELVKAAFVLRGQAMRKALEGLLREAAASQGINRESAAAITRELIRRLQELGQKGWRDKALRFDSLPRDTIKELVASVDPGLVPALQIRLPDAGAILRLVGEKAEQWYDLAMNPVTERYKRRMRVLALATSAVLVIPLNVGAHKVWTAARTDADFRKSVIAVVQAIDSMPPDTVTAPAATVPADPGDTTRAAPGDSAAVRERAARQRQLAQGTRALGTLADSAIFRFGLPSSDELGKPGWWFGVALSILFVSLGAPFWHDLFELIFGLKNRARRDPPRGGVGAAR